ncbi:16S rRNA (uracil(1498)-N(3))-methyltransferase [Mycoplasmopsis bovirhinis]|uniref:16S rRNA (uracil(1498)-N(3))-methyltransferase n=1 Tax=Mycoplasmopsis bovirhinis TaxID=29553 RepID=UPI000C05B638|nr:16S rRNA (uracil(1498)-N(3))-methyltransferase [Mycoplasmopsis bovirhinis]ATO31000.1 16S rRNA (uracil(1498)-N(3))-methyltransferase [Mycoplasmopsis bovirhinis]
MQRFFVFEKEDDYFILSKETLKHLNVIRINQNPFICVYQSKFYKCVLEVDKAKIINELHQNHEFDFDVTVALSLIKYERFEWALQKLVELGATKIIPLITSYTNGELYKYDKFIKRKKRFESIIQGAAEQSFRNILPVLSDPIDFKNLIHNEASLKIIAHEKQDYSISMINDINQDTLFVIGPEGGFSEHEIELALKHGFKCVSLGKRILRAETAAIYLMSKIKV